MSSTDSTGPGAGGAAGTEASSNSVVNNDMLQMTAVLKLSRSGWSSLTDDLKSCISEIILGNLPQDFILDITIMITHTLSRGKRPKFQYEQNNEKIILIDANNNSKSSSSTTKKRKVVQNSSLGQNSGVGQNSVLGQNSSLGQNSVLDQNSGQTQKMSVQNKNQVQIGNQNVILSQTSHSNLHFTPPSTSLTSPSNKTTPTNSSTPSSQNVAALMQLTGTAARSRTSSGGVGDDNINTTPINLQGVS